MDGIKKFLRQALASLVESSDIESRLESRSHEDLTEESSSRGSGFCVALHSAVLWRGQPRS